jgi:Type II CAAX prenyl endopeptidase Rce1-like
VPEVPETPEARLEARWLARPARLLLRELRIPGHNLPGKGHRATREAGGEAELEASPDGQEAGPFTALVRSAFAFVLLFSLALMVFSIAAGGYAVLFTKLSPGVSQWAVPSSVYFFIGPLLLVLPNSLSYAAIFMISTAVAGAFLVGTAFLGDGPLAGLAAYLRAGSKAVYRNQMLMVPVTVGFLIFTSLMLDGLEGALGVPVGTVTCGSQACDPLVLFVSLALAPLREEFGFRLLLIGFVALVASIGTSWRTAAHALWRPSYLKEQEPAHPVYSIALIAALIVSSVAFGLEHIIGSSGWEIGKLPEAAVAGVILGYAYIRYGFHMAVLAHWGVDYFSNAFGFYGQGVYGVAWNTLGTSLQAATYFDLVIFLGLGSFLLVASTWVTDLLAKHRTSPEAL